MCAIIEDRIRINKIMSHTLSVRLNNRPENLDELAHLCVVALQLYYDGACPEECLEASGLIHSDDSQIGRSSPSSHYKLSL